MSNDAGKEHNEGIICSSACLGGPLSKDYWAHREQGPEAVKRAMSETVGRFKDIFVDRFYGELQWNAIPEQHDVNQYIIDNTSKNGEWKSIKSLDSLMNYITLSGWIFVPQNGVLNEIINSGKLLLIENDLIKNEIASLPQLHSLMIEEDRQYRLDLHQYFLPFLSKNYNLIELTKYRELLENYSFKMGETNFSKSIPGLLNSREFENILTIQSIWIKFSNEMSINQKNKYLEIQNLIEKEYPEVDYTNLRQNLERGIFG